MGLTFLPMVSSGNILTIKVSVCDIDYLSCVAFIHRDIKFHHLVSKRKKNVDTHIFVAWYKVGCGLLDELTYSPKCLDLN